jgi:hypothetical protein
MILFNLLIIDIACTFAVIWFVLFMLLLRYDNVTLSPFLLPAGAQAEWGLRYRIYALAITVFVWRGTSKL